MIVIVEVCSGFHNNPTGQVIYKQQKLIYHSSEGLKPEIKMPAWSGSLLDEGPLPGSQTAPLYPPLAQGARSVLTPLFSGH